jgi:16S rRNA (guanine527-N7)-methyltransferase
MPESEEALKALIQESGIGLDSDTSRQLQTFLSLLKKWNSRMNLTSGTRWDVVGPLFQEGIWAANLYPKDAMRHLDIGSGAGFPAILLKILNARLRLDLVESRKKRAIFLETAAHALKLGGICVHAMRLQDFMQQTRPDETWDCISWKALKLSSGDLRMLLEHVGAATQLWMFHGNELAVEDSAVLDRHFRLLRTEKFPGRKLWALSIYLRR